MRTEKEMLDLIVAVAQEDERVRAAYLEGSRANPKAPEDIFQDYDIVYIVEETASFREGKGAPDGLLNRLRLLTAAETACDDADTVPHENFAWIDTFGERLYMQYPEDSVYYEADIENCYGWLMQLADGNRIDLHVCTRQYALGHLEMYRVLLDKDGVFTQTEDSSDERYWVQRPDAAQFSCTCNEFWWCLNNVAKGLWRDELPYVMDMIDFCVRPMLRRMLDWKAGLENGFSISTGKSSKYLKNYLTETEYKSYLSTYAPAGTDAVWDAVFRMCSLFDDEANEISARLGFSYNRGEAGNSRMYLEKVRAMSGTDRSKTTA